MVIRKSISFPSELHAEIVRLSKENNRSFTRQVVWMLEQIIKQKVIVVVKDETDAKEKDVER